MCRARILQQCQQMALCVLVKVRVRNACFLLASVEQGFFYSTVVSPFVTIVGYNFRRLASSKADSHNPALINMLSRLTSWAGLSVSTLDRKVATALFLRTQASQMTTIVVWQEGAPDIPSVSVCCDDGGVLISVFDSKLVIYLCAYHNSHSYFKPKILHWGCPNLCFRPSSSLKFSY